MKRENNDRLNLMLQGKGLVSILAIVAFFIVIVVPYIWKIISVPVILILEKIGLFLSRFFAFLVVEYDITVTLCIVLAVITFIILNFILFLSKGLFEEKDIRYLKSNKVALMLVELAIVLSCGLWFAMMATPSLSLIGLIGAVVLFFIFHAMYSAAFIFLFFYMPYRKRIDRYSRRNKK